MDEKNKTLNPPLQYSESSQTGDSLQLCEGSADLFQITFSNETSFPVCITVLHSEMRIEMRIVYYCSVTFF